MDAKEYRKYIEELFSSAIALHEKKAHDYSRGDDVLSNFKRLPKVAKIMDIDVKTPMGYVMFMLLLKIDRINNLVGKGISPKNEAIDDTILDMIVYSTLMGGCIKDEKGQSPPNKLGGL